jgi:UDP-N-acetylglucosamine transferase subunit ALG13
MIFATVGTQLPFERFITALDKIAGKHKLDVFAQTCDPAAKVEHIRASAHVDPATFDKHIREADRIVGHAGIGTILSARKLQKPLILYPRLASLGEHRNEHQLATVRSLVGRVGIYVAYNDEELEELLTRPELAPLRSEESAARNALIGRLREFIAA